MSKINSTEQKILVDTLKAAMKTSPVARYLHRLHCVALVSQNHKAQEVASWFGHDPSSVARWTRHFNTFGVEGLRDDQKTGRLAKLNFDQMQALARDLNQLPILSGYSRPKWDGRLLAIHLQKKYNVKYSLRQCQRLLRQLRETTKRSESQKQLEEVE